MGMARELFLDTSYVVAAASVRDRHHREALEWGARLQEGQTRLVTTRGVLFEVGNALARPASRVQAASYLMAVEKDPAVMIVEATPERFAQALRLYSERPDKEWGLVDCLSFVVMEEHGLWAALTADDHFRQAGFRALLLEEA